MKVYELSRNGKRSKYRTLELALTAAVKGETKSRWIFGYRDGLAFALRRIRDGK